MRSDESARRSIASLARLSGCPPPLQRVVWAVGLIATTLWLGCAAQRERGGDLPTAEVAIRVFQLAGVDGQVRALSDQLVGAATLRGADLAPGSAEELIENVRAVAAESPMLSVAEALFRARSQGSPFLEPADRFLGSETGRRLRALESQADSELDEDAYSAYVDELFAAPVPLERIRLLERLAVATRGAQIAADIESIAARVVARAVDRRGGETSDALAAAFERIDRQRVETVATLRAQSMVSMQYVYRRASDQELAEYVAFAESPAGAWLVDTTGWTLGELEPWLDARMTDRPGKPR